MHRTYLYLLVVLSISPKIIAQELLTPEEAFKLALEYNYSIKISNNDIEIAKNNRNILNSGYLPTLSATAGSTIDKLNTEGELANGETRVAQGAETRRYNAALNLNYTLFDGLGRYYNYKILKEQYQLSELEARETIENTMIELFSIYYTVAQLSENMTALEETLNISKDRLIRAGYQFDYGQNTKLGVLNAEVDINNDSVNLITANQQLKNSKRDLSVVLGNSMNGSFEVDTIVAFPVLFNKTKLLEKALANNIRLLQVEKDILISDFTIKSNRSGYLPTVGLQGSYSWNESANNSPLAFTLQNTSSGLSAGLNLVWNLFDGGITITQVKNAKIRLETQGLIKDQILMEIERNFNNAWDDYQNKLAIFRIQEDNIRTAKNNFDRTQEQFKIGQVTSIEFRQAQLNLLNAELSRNRAKYDAKLSELSLLQISGELLNFKF